MTGGGDHGWGDPGYPGGQGAPGGPTAPGYDWAADGPQQSRNSRWIVLVVGAVAILVVVFLAILLFQLRGGGGDGGLAGGGPVTVTSTVQTEPSPSVSPPTPTATPTARGSEPPGLIEECSDSGSAVLPRAGRASGATSCPFARTVRDAYLATASPGDPASVDAYSPVTGQSYQMRCTGDDRHITCRGGNNAVVYLY